MSLFRTFLFVPGSNYDWFEKLSDYDSDNIILDLEDSVPIDKKNEAKEHVANSISKLSKSQNVYVRINRDENDFYDDELQAVIQEDLTGIVLPKITGPQDIERLSEQISEIEMQKNLRVGKTTLLPILETAHSMYFAYEIAVHKRVVAIAGLTAKDGDVQRAINYQWTAKGTETLYIRSKIVLAARAAGVKPIGGLWQDVHNLEGLKSNSLFNRQLGFDGEMILHPSNVRIVNNVYSPTSAEINYYKGMVDAFKAAKKKGLNATMYKGNHIDMAHVKTAKEVLDFYNKLNNYD